MQKPFAESTTIKPDRARSPPDPLAGTTGIIQSLILSIVLFTESGAGTSKTLAAHFHPHFSQSFLAEFRATG